MSRSAARLLLLILASSLHAQQPPQQPDNSRVQTPPQPTQASSPPATNPPAMQPHSAPDPHWQDVEQLPPGKAIAVIEHGRRYSTSCTMDLADDTSLACIQSSPYTPPRRIVFPISSVAAVFTEQVEFGPSNKAVIIGIVIGAGVGAAVCHEASGGAGVIAACSLLGAAIGWAVPTTAPPGPQPPRIHRRLIYRAP